MSEHLDTKSVVTSRSSLEHNTVIFIKWRPSGRSSNRRAARRVPLTILRPRDPVSLGDVKGTFHPLGLLSGIKEASVRSLRRGKEQTRSKNSKLWTDVRRSDLRVGESPCNGTREA